jgi:hypothetical protein
LTDINACVFDFQAIMQHEKHAKKDLPWGRKR